MESEINAFGTSCYRITLNEKRIDRVSNATIYDLTQAAPLVKNVRTRQLRSLGHVLRLPGDKPCKEYALYIPPHEKRKPGRQGTLFLTYIQHLLGDTDDMIGQDKLSELAQDRCDNWANSGSNMSASGECVVRENKDLCGILIVCLSKRARKVISGLTSLPLMQLPEWFIYTSAV
ncbi:hypothetical protein P5673_008073 [Acropora cervicornis]|uniref:Uncharacterized protein n=1 Tax=Acropora cervicornis TaxID=6130 RepID=A0AAD9QTN7_ACRCE|nr:hypothetical protein P5673_008073 [Acropora cervicornis]